MDSQRNPGSGRPEAAFVLLLIQSASWLLAGISAIPFAVAGERGMALLALLSILLASGTGWLGVALLYRARRARRLVLALQWTCLVGGLILWILPIGGSHGLVAFLTDLGLPALLLWLLHGRRARAECRAAVDPGPDVQERGPAAVIQQ